MINKNWAFYTLLIFVLLLICLFAFVIISDIVQTSKLNKQNEMLKARGIKTSIKEIIKVKPQKESTVQIINEANKVLASEDMKTTPSLEKLFFDALDDWGKLTKEDKETLKVEIERRKEIFNKFLTAAKDPNASLDIDLNTFIYSLDFNFAKFRDLFRWVVIIQGKLFMEEGNTSGTLACARDGIKITTFLFNTPAIISSIIGINILSNSFNLIQESLSGLPISSEDGIELLNSLNQIPDIKAKLVLTIDAERLAAIAMLNKILQGDKKLTDMFFPLREDLTFLRKPAMFILRGTIKEDINMLNDYYNNCIAAFDQPYQVAIMRFKELERRIEELSRIHFVLKTFMPGFTGMNKNILSCKAKVDITKTAITLKVYKSEKDKFPDTLYDLVPEYLENLPMDPFTYNDYIYRKLSNGGFILYSPFLKESSQADICDDNEFLEKQSFSSGLFTKREKEPDVILWYEKPYSNKTLNKSEATFYDK